MSYEDEESEDEDEAGTQKPLDTEGVNDTSWDPIGNVDSASFVGGSRSRSRLQGCD